MSGTQQTPGPCVQGAHFNLMLRKHSIADSAA